ncbi:MAG: hypothetical protein V2A73_10465, partial [Pseudomonadota bacterium]
VPKSRIGHRLASPTDRDPSNETGARNGRAPDRAIETQLERLAAIGAGEYRLLPNPATVPVSTGQRQIAFSAWARRHVEAGLDSLRARTFAAEMAGARLALRKHLLPDPATLDDTDRRILEAMAAPRRLDELEHQARSPRLRLLAFLHFLHSVGALELTGVAARPVPLTTQQQRFAPLELGHTGVAARGLCP